MANVVFGPYSPTTWVDNTTQGNHTTLNNLETQCSVALHGFNSDLFTAFIEDGVVPTKDGSIVNQLDTTAGLAYITVSDGTLSTVTVAASTTSQFLTSALSTTYHLYLQPDGTWYWSTSNSPQAHSLHICDVTTDGLGDIVTVTDQRQLSTTLLNNVTAANGGAIQVNSHFHVGGTLYGNAGVLTIGDHLSLDGGNITSDGAGKLTIKKLSSDSAAFTSDGSGNVTATSFTGPLTGNASGSAGSVAAANVSSGILGAGVSASYTIGTGFSIAATGGGVGAVIGHNTSAADITIASINGVGIGFKFNGMSGTKIAQMKNDGTFTADAAFKTVGATSTISTGASFDTFDIAEAYPVDQHYEPGTVLCPHGEVFSRCEHDNCQAAGIVSTGGAFYIGGGEFTYDPDDATPVKDPQTIDPIALAGRVTATTSDESIQPRDLLCSNGKGGVRAARSGDVWSIGYALNSPTGGQVGVFVRPCWVRLGRKKGTVTHA